MELILMLVGLVSAVWALVVLAVRYFWRTPTPEPVTMRTMEWFDAMRELDDAEPYPEMRYYPQPEVKHATLNIPETHRKMMTMTPDERRHALKLAYREQQIIRNMAGQIVAEVPSVEEITRHVGFQPENAVPTAIITVPEGHRYEAWWWR